MNPRLTIGIFAFVAIALVAIALLSKRNDGARTRPSQAEVSPQPPSTDLTSDKLDSSQVAQPRPSEPSPPEAGQAPLAAAPDSLQQTTNSVKRSAEEILSELSEGAIESEQMLSSLAELKALANDQQARTNLADDLLEFLLTGRDRSTGLAFAVGEDGVLSSTGHLRSTALDLLGQIDLDRALTYAADHVFSAPNSSEEWAIALRNLVWSNVDNSKFKEIRDHFLTLTNQQKWLNAPDNAFLNSFDVAVYLSDSDSFHQLAQLSSSTDPAISHAAMLAMDRMVLRQPGSHLHSILDNPSIFAANPIARAHLMSRANLTDDTHRELIQRYLTADFVTEAEADSFARSFPNYNLAMSNRLLSSDKSEKKSLADYALRDSAALQFLIDQKSEISPAFRSGYDQLIAKVQRFVDSAAK